MPEPVSWYVPAQNKPISVTVDDAPETDSAEAAPAKANKASAVVPRRTCFMHSTWFVKDACGGRHGWQLEDAKIVL